MKKAKWISLIALILCALLLLAGCGAQQSGGTQLELVTSLDQAILALASGKCDAVALDGTTAKNYVDQSDGLFAMSGINFDLSLYGEYEGNVVAVKKGETDLIQVINLCIQTALDEDYYSLWTAIAKLQSGTDDDAARELVGDMPIYSDAPIDSRYLYLLDSSDLVKPELDLSNAQGVLAQVLEVIQKLAESGMTCVIVTHEMGFARRISDRVLFIDGGVVCESGTAEELFERPQNPRTQQFLSQVL